MSPMNMQQLLHTADSISTWVGKAFAWLIVALMLMVVVEVFKRYALNSPTAWIFDASNMMYGTLFMMGGAYTLCQDGHVRGDFFYGSAKPKTQAWLDLVLYIVFFIPGVIALTWAGWTYAADSWAIHEQTFNADPLPQSITLAPIAGQPWQLHPVHRAAGAADLRAARQAAVVPATGTFTVPGRTAVVFVRP